MNQQWKLTIFTHLIRMCRTQFDITDTTSRKSKIIRTVTIIFSEVIPPLIVLITVGHYFKNNL